MSMVAAMTWWLIYLCVITVLVFYTVTIRNMTKYDRNCHECPSFFGSTLVSRVSVFFVWATLRARCFGVFFDWSERYLTGK